MQGSSDPAQSAHAASRVVHNVRSQARLIDDLLDISAHPERQAPPRAEDGRCPHGDPEGCRGRRLGCSSASGDRVIAGRRSDAAADRPGAPGASGLEPPQQRRRGDPRRRPHPARGAAPRRPCRHRGAGLGSRHRRRRSAAHLRPFKQSGDHANRHRGLGLGLAITSSIVRLLGGTVQAQSAGRGQGATFTVTLPARGAEASPSEDDVHGALSSAERSGRGLACSVAGRCDILEAGVGSVDARGRRRGLLQLRRGADARRRVGDFDVLLTDLDLGGGRSGIEWPWPCCVDRRRPRGRARHSAYGSREDRDASKEPGFADTLVASGRRDVCPRVAGSHATIAMKPRKTPSTPFPETVRASPTSWGLARHTRAATAQSITTARSAGSPRTAAAGRRSQRAQRAFETGAAFPHQSGS